MTFSHHAKRGSLDIRHCLPDLIRVERHRYGRYQPPRQDLKVLIVKDDEIRIDENSFCAMGKSVGFVFYSHRLLLLPTGKIEYFYKLS